MATIYLRDFPNDLYAKLAEIAEEQKRRRPGQIAWFLEWCIEYYDGDEWDRQRLLTQLPVAASEEKEMSA